MMSPKGSASDIQANLDEPDSMANIPQTEQAKLNSSVLDATEQAKQDRTRDLSPSTPMKMNSSARDKWTLRESQNDIGEEDQARET